MMQLEEITPDWCVFLAIRDFEPAQLLSAILDGFGYRVLEGQDQDAASHALSQSSPTVAVIDLTLPQADQLCQTFRQQANPIPLLVLVSQEETDAEARCRQLGADGFERIDAHPERLLQALRRLIDRNATPGSSDQE